MIGLISIGGCGDESAATTKPSGGAAGAGATGGAAKGDPVAIKLAAVRTEAVDLAVDVTGTLYGDEQVIIAAKVPGRISATYRDFGDRVDEGAELAQVDRTDYELAVAQREAALGEALSKLGLETLPADSNFDVTRIATVQRAKVQADNAAAKLERARKLFQQTPPLMSSQDFADIETAQQVSLRDYDVAVLQAKSDLSTARLRSKEVDSARQRLADSRVAAPQAGRQPRSGRYAVVRRDVAVGSYVREGDPLFQLIADDPIRFRADIPERFMSAVKLGQTVRLTLEGGIAAEGKVTRINPSIDVASRTFQMEASLDNASHTLRPGAFVRANIIIGQEPAATFVPKQSVASFAGVHRVFSVADGKAKEHQVSLGETRGDYIRVTPNLKGVESVATGPVSRLGGGMPVKIDESPTAATVSSR